MCSNANLSVGRDDLALNQKTRRSDVIVEEKEYQRRPVTALQVQVWSTAGTEV